jgi:type VI secretion system protein ImpA
MTASASLSAIDLDAIRRPISGDHPSGPDLTFSATDRVYQQIRTARPQDSALDIPDELRGLLGQQATPADWSRVARLGLDALASRTKDLNIAAWVVEALVHMRGIAGLADGLGLLRTLQDTFWDTLHPAIEAGDDEFRAAPYTFLAQELPPLLRSDVPLAGLVDAGPDLRVRGHEQARASNSLEAWARPAAQGNPGQVAQAAIDLVRCREAFDLWKAQTLAQLPRSAPDLARISQALGDFESATRALDPFLPRPKAPAAPAPEPSTPPLAPESSPPRAASEEPTSEPSRVAPAEVGPAERAAVLARQGRFAEAMALLDSARQTSRSRRDRFLFQLQLAELCVDAKRPRVALPLLEELETEIEERKLEEWEEHRTCGRVLHGLLRALRALKDDDVSRINRYYLRLCKLDPQLAFQVEPPPEND